MFTLVDSSALTRNVNTNNKNRNFIISLHVVAEISALMTEMNDSNDCVRSLKGCLCSLRVSFIRTKLENRLLGIFLDDNMF